MNKNCLLCLGVLIGSGFLSGTLGVPPKSLTARKPCIYQLDLAAFTLVHHPMMVPVSENFTPLIVTPRLIIGSPEEFPFLTPSFSFQLVDRKTFEFRGRINLSDVSNVGGGYLTSAIVMESQGQGLGTEAEIAMMNYAFDVLKVIEVRVEIDEENMRSIYFHRRLGFRKAYYRTYVLRAADFAEARDRFGRGELTFRSRPLR